MAEWNIGIDEIIRCHEEFKKFVANDFNKNMILHIIENCVKSKEWPQKYYSLRDEYLPGLIGENASKFLFWFLLTTQEQKETCSLSYTTNELNFLNYLCFNYSETFFKAKLFNINPLGFFEIHYTHGSEKDKVNAYISRNDGENFVLRLGTLEFIKMIEQSFYYFSQMVSNSTIDYSRDKETTLQGINDIKEYLNEIECKIRNEEAKNG